MFVIAWVRNDNNFNAIRSSDLCAMFIFYASDKIFVWKAHWVLFTNVYYGSGIIGVYLMLVRGRICGLRQMAMHFRHLAKNDFVHCWIVNKTMLAVHMGKVGRRTTAPRLKGRRIIHRWEFWIEEPFFCHWISQPKSKFVT